MRYCTKCGKPLEDGKICSCQVQNSADIPAKKHVTDFFGTTLIYVKDFVKDPVGTSGAVVGEHSLATVKGVIIINLAFRLFYNIIAMLINAVKGEHYAANDWGMGILRPIIWWVVIPMVFAVLIRLCAKYVEGYNVSFDKALSVFSIPALPLLVFTFINILELVFTHTFFNVIFGVVRAAMAGSLFYLTGVGILKVLPPSKRFVYSIAIICAGLYFANWLVTEAIF